MAMTIWFWLWLYEYDYDYDYGKLWVSMKMGIIRVWMTITLAWLCLWTWLWLSEYYNQTGESKLRELH